jgi:hypothetical protein
MVISADASVRRNNIPYSGADNDILCADADYETIYNDCTYAKTDRAYPFTDTHPAKHSAWC